MQPAITTMKISRKICSFCKSCEDNEVLYGKFYEKGDIVTHYFCLLLSSNIAQNGSDDEGILGFLLLDIYKELKRGQRVLCSYCFRGGATISCSVNKCKKVFHLPCGVKKGSLHQFFGHYKSFCHGHRPHQKICARILKEVQGSAASCTICFEDVSPTPCHDTIWAPCCGKNAWFHRNCIQALALSSGYFFKCPQCNDKSNFEKAMLKLGIFIPEQDASWELVPHAYEELLHRHNRCDAPKCKCPKGRKYNDADSRWEIILCKFCGAQGIHKACGLTKWSKPVWECTQCLAMLQSAQEHHHAAPDGNEQLPLANARPLPPSNARPLPPANARPPPLARPSPMADARPLPPPNVRLLLPASSSTTTPLPVANAATSMALSCQQEMQGQEQRDDEDDDIIFIDSDDENRSSNYNVAKVEPGSISNQVSVIQSPRVEDIIIFDSDDEIEVAYIDTHPAKSNTAFSETLKTVIPAEEDEDIIIVDDSDSEDFNSKHIVNRERRPPPPTNYTIPIMPVHYNDIVQTKEQAPARLVQNKEQQPQQVGDVLIAKDGAAIPVVQVSDTSMSGQRFQVEGDVNVTAKPMGTLFTMPTALMFHQQQVSFGSNSSPQMMCDLYAATKKRRLEFSGK